MIKERKIMSDMKLLYRIDDNKDYTNMGGIAIDENGTLYCVKSSSDDEKQCLYVINDYERAKKTNGFVNPSRIHKYVRLGHANSLTLSDGYLYVGTNENYIIKLSTTKLKGTKHEAGTKIDINSDDADISSIAAVGNNQFIVHFSGQGDSYARQRVYFSSEITDTVEYSAEKMKTFTYPDTLKIKADNTEAQDMFYKDGYLYFIVAEKDDKSKEFTKSHTFKYHYESGTYVGHVTFTNTKAKKFEIESMYIVDKKLVFSVNESKVIIEKVKVNGKMITKTKTVNNWDAIYTVENWELASKEIIIPNENK